MSRNKYNAKFFDDAEKIEKNPNYKLDNDHDPTASTKLENDNDYPQVEFGNEESINCQAMFEEKRRKRNKPKNLK